MKVETPDNWDEMLSKHLTGNGYRNIHRGWENTDYLMNNEVLVFHTEGTCVEEGSDKPVAVQHPLDEDGENLHYFDSIEEAVEYAENYMNKYPTLPDPN